MAQRVCIIGGGVIGLTTAYALVRGQVTIIGPQLSGYVFEVPVQDFKFVKTRWVGDVVKVVTPMSGMRSHFPHQQQLFILCDAGRH